MEGNPQQQGAQAVYRALAVLDAFDAGRFALSVGEIASTSGLTVPTAHRIVGALADRGFLVRDEVTRTFGIGPSILRLARVAGSSEAAFAFVTPLIRSVRDECQETVGLHVRVGGRRVCVSEIESPHRVRVVSGVGQTWPLTAAASSKAILAYTNEVDVAEILAVAPGVDGDALRSSLVDVRERGFAVSSGETIPGARAVAAPVFDAEGCVIAAINITGPAERLPFERLNELGRDLAMRLQQIQAVRYAGPALSAV